MAAITQTVVTPCPLPSPHVINNKNQTDAVKSEPQSSGEHALRQTDFHQLRRDVARIGGQMATARLPFGVSALDAALAGGLALGRVHMICGRPGHDGAMIGFVVAVLRRLLAQRDGPIVWCPAAALGASGMLYAPGLAALGLDPARLLIVDAPSPAARLASLEDILRTEGLAAVVVEYDGINQSSDYWARLARRAQLAAESSGTTGFLLGWPVAASGFDSQWRVAPARPVQSVPHANSDLRASSSKAATANRPWYPVWNVELNHARGGRAHKTGLLWESLGSQFRACPLQDGRQQDGRQQDGRQQDGHQQDGRQQDGLWQDGLLPLRVVRKKSQKDRCPEGYQNSGLKNQTQEIQHLDAG